MAAKIKKGDKVFIVSGKDKGKEGEVTKIIKTITNQDKALVQGINLVKRHRKPSQDNPGGIISEERPIQISNLMIVDPKTKKPTTYHLVVTTSSSLALLNVHYKKLPKHPTLYN